MLAEPSGDLYPPYLVGNGENGTLDYIYNNSEPTFCPESDVLFLIEENDAGSWNSSMIFIRDVVEDIDIDGIRYGIIRYSEHSLVYLTFSASEILDKDGILNLIENSLEPSFNNDNVTENHIDLAGALFESFDLFDTDSDDTRQRVLITVTSGVPDNYLSNQANTCDDGLFPFGNPFIAGLVTFDIHHILVVYGNPIFVDYGALSCLVSDDEEYMFTLPFGSISNDTTSEIKDFADRVADVTCYSPTTTTVEPTGSPTDAPTGL